MHLQHLQLLSLTSSRFDQRKNGTVAGQWSCSKHHLVPTLQHHLNSSKAAEGTWQANKKGVLLHCCLSTAQRLWAAAVFTACYV
jgi:hypothetical protein